MIEANRPKNFHSDSPESILKELDVSFENLCASMEEAGVNNPKSMTVFEFNQRIEYFKQKKVSSKNREF